MTGQTRSFETLRPGLSGGAGTVRRASFSASRPFSARRLANSAKLLTIYLLHNAATSSTMLSQAGCCEKIVEASLEGRLEWTEWAYTRHERDQLVQDAKDCGFSYTVEEHE